MSASAPGIGNTAQQPTAASVLFGQLSLAATGGPTTIITVPAGRTFVGRAYIAVSAGVSAASAEIGDAFATLSTSGAGAVPAGTILKVPCFAGAGTAASVSGSGATAYAWMDITVFAPGGNAVAVQGSLTANGSFHEADFTVIGQLL